MSLISIWFFEFKRKSFKLDREYFSLEAVALFYISVFFHVSNTSVTLCLKLLQHYVSLVICINPYAPIWKIIQYNNLLMLLAWSITFTARYFFPKSFNGCFQIKSCLSKMWHKAGDSARWLLAITTQVLITKNARTTHSEGSKLIAIKASDVSWWETDIEEICWRISSYEIYKHSFRCRNQKGQASLKGQLEEPRCARINQACHSILSVAQ